MKGVKLVNKGITGRLTEIKQSRLQTMSQTLFFFFFFPNVRTEWIFPFLETHEEIAEGKRRKNKQFAPAGLDTTTP